MATSRLNQNSLLFTSDGSTQLSKLTAEANLFTMAGSSGNCRLTGVSDPTSPQDSATKAYVDSKINGVTWKQAVTAATSSDITRDSGSSANTIEGTGNGALPAQDGVTMEASERLLVKDQSDAQYNGIYIVTRVGDASSTYLLTRTEDNNSDSEMSGAAVFVTEGTLSADTGWVMSTDTITLNTTDLSWSKFSHTGGNVAGSGITVSGREISIASGAVTNAMLAGSISASNLAGSIPDSKITDLDASKLTGTLASARIANSSLGNDQISALSATKLSTGTLPMDRITSGAILDDKINDLSASKLTGTLSNDRLSNVPATKLDLALGLSSSGTSLKIDYDDGTIGISAESELFVKNLGIDTAQLANDSVNGSKLTDDITILTTSTITASTFTSSSDKRLKENIEDVEDALDKVCAMEGKIYNFKSKPEEKRAGVIAQDLSIICPELVKEDDKGMLSVNYTDVIPYLIEAIKELKEKITQ